MLLEKLIQSPIQKLTISRDSFMSTSISHFIGYRDWIWHELDIQFKHWDAREVYLFLKDISPSTEAGFWCLFVCLAYHSHSLQWRSVPLHRHFIVIKRASFGTYRTNGKETTGWSMGSFMIQNFLSRTFCFLQTKFSNYDSNCVCVCVYFLLIII